MTCIPLKPAVVLCSSSSSHGALFLLCYCAFISLAMQLLLFLRDASMIPVPCTDGPQLTNL